MTARNDACENPWCAWCGGLHPSSTCQHAAEPSPEVAPRETQQQPLEELAKQEMSPFERDYFSAPATPATQHRVIPVEWHRVAVDTCHAAKDGDCTWSKCPQVREGEPARSGRHCPLPDCPNCLRKDCDGYECTRPAVEPGDNAPARVEPTCTCVTNATNYECPVHWPPEPATDDRTADTIPLHSRISGEYGDYLRSGPGHKMDRDDWLVEKIRGAETRIEVLEAALRGLLSFMWSEGYSDQSPAMKTAEEVGINGLDKR